MRFNWKNLKKIDQNDLSVVLNGPFNKHTYNAVKRVLKVLPKSKIIVSCWEQDDTTLIENIPNVLIVKSKDPGGLKLPGVFQMGMNYNRMIVAVRAGLNFVDTKYVLRMRNDLLLHDDRILIDYNYYFPKKEEKYGLFKEKIVTLSSFTQKIAVLPEYNDVNVSVSDWLHLGLTEDVKLYWNRIELIENQEEFANYYSNHPKYKDNDYAYKVFAFPEVYFTSFSVKEKFEIKNTGMYDTKLTDEEKEVNKHILFNNFIPLNYNMTKIWNQKSRYMVPQLLSFALFESWFYLDFLYWYQETFKDKQVQSRFGWINKSKNMYLSHWSFVRKMKISNKKEHIVWIFRLLTIWFLNILYMLFVKVFYRFVFLFEKRNFLKFKIKKN